MPKRFLDNSIKVTRRERSVTRVEDNSHPGRKSDPGG